MAIKTRTTITTASLMDSLGLSRRQVQALRSKINWAAEDALRRSVDADFLKKANKQTGVTGKWQKLAESTIERKGHDIIGWETGKMRKSRRVTTNNRGLKAEYRKDYAKYFDEKRPLLPKELPKAWQKEIEKSIQKTVDRHIGSKKK